MAAEESSSWEVCDSQKEKIKRLIETPLKAGDTWYLIECKWVRQWQRYVGFDSWDTNLVGDKSAYPGPIDNKPLFIDGTSFLQPTLTENIDFAFVPEEAWNSLVQWYTLAAGHEPIARKVIDVKGVFDRNCSIEVYLIDLKLCHNDNLGACMTKYFSHAATLEQVEKVMRKMFNIPDDKEVKLWSKYRTNTYKHRKKLSKTLIDAHLIAGQVIIIEEKNSNGTWPRQSKVGDSGSADGGLGPSRCQDVVPPQKGWLCDDCFAREDPPPTSFWSKRSE